MGLCKCPKKKVTNLFCFEHRVNVCENCLVANHRKCVIKSYLQWLQDSDYNPNCPLCSQSLNQEQNKECVRLTCYDVFHWSCLNQYAQQFPANTAPAGYTCPTCSAGIFPAQNMASPVADHLKTYLSKVNWARAGLGLPLVYVYLSKVNWARAGLGLPLIDEPHEPPVPTPEQHITQNSQGEAIPVTHSTPVKNSYIKSEPSLTADVNGALGASPNPLGVSPNPLGASPNPQEASVHSPMSTPNYTRPSAHVSPTQHSVINVDAGTSVRGQEKLGFADPRKLFDSTKEDQNALLNMSHDHDENKYKRRSALEWLTRWLKSRENKRGRKDPGAVRKRFIMVLLLGVIGFITIIVIFTKLGRSSVDDDPFVNNPNVRVIDDGPLD